jgi:hypothetical protein
MTKNRFSELKALEGRQVSLALADGSRIDDCQLVSAGHGRTGTLWVYTNGCDAFLSAEEVVDLWELRTTVTDRVACGLGQHIGLSEWSVPSGALDSYVRQPA